jgi:hypothetical protein
MIPSRQRWKSVVTDPFVALQVAFAVLGAPIAAQARPSPEVTHSFSGTSKMFRFFAILVGITLATAACESSRSPAQPSVPPEASFTVAGAIYEELPNGARGLPIADARVEVAGTKTPTVATTDEAGRYTLSGLIGTLNLTVSKSGYETTTVGVGPLRADTTVEATLRAPARTLIGVVSETPPTATTPVGGVQVRIVSGPGIGLEATTDGNGYYSIPGVAGDFELSLSRAGYEPHVAHVSAARSVTRVDVNLMPDSHPVNTRLDGQLCADFAFWFPGAALFTSPCTAAPVQVHHYIPVHRPGALEVALNWEYREDYSAEYMWLEVRCGSTKADQLFALYYRDANTYMVPSRGNVGAGLRGPLRVMVPEPATCEVKPYGYWSFKGYIALTTFRIDVTHPK